MVGNVVIEHVDAGFTVDPRAKKIYRYPRDLYSHETTFGLWAVEEGQYDLDESEKIAALRALGNGETLSSIFDESRPTLNDDSIKSAGMLRQVGVRGSRFDKGTNPAGMTFPAGVGTDWSRIVVMESEPLVTDGTHQVWSTTFLSGSIRFQRLHNANNGEAISSAVGTTPNDFISATWPNIPTGEVMAAIDGWNSTDHTIALSVNGYAPIVSDADAGAEATQTLIAMGSTLGGGGNEGFTGKIYAFGIDTLNLLDPDNPDAVAKLAVWKQWIRDRYPSLKTKLI